MRALVYHGPGEKKHAVVLGGGTGGTLAANRLRRMYAPDQLAITVVDRDDRHVYQPGLLFVPFGLTHAEDIVRPRRRQLHDTIAFVESATHTSESSTTNDSVTR
jgi:sulfide:quinone oxidoreductase